jgi:hypothetical protein
MEALRRTFSRQEAGRLAAVGKGKVSGESAIFEGTYVGGPPAMNGTTRTCDPQKEWRQQPRGSAPESLQQPDAADCIYKGEVGGRKFAGDGGLLLDFPRPPHDAPEQQQHPEHAAERIREFVESGA